MEALVKLKFLNGTHLPVTVDLTSCVRDLKDQVLPLTGLDPLDQRFIHAGRGMEDGRTLLDYNVQEGSIIHVILRLPFEGVSLDVFYAMFLI